MYRSYRTVLCRCNSLLQSTHFSRKCRLITNRRRNTSDKCRNLRTGLCKSENIINKQKHVLMLLISEIFSHCKSRKRNSHSCTRRLVHLTVNKRSLIDNARLFHFIIKVVTLSRSLADTGENTDTAVFLSDIIDKLHYKNSLADTGTAEKTYFTAFCIRCNKVNNLNTRFKYFRCRILFFVCRRLTMYTPFFFCFGIRHIINRITQNVKNSSECFFTDRHFNSLTCINGVHTSDKSVRRAHRNTSDNIVAYMLCNFRNKPLTFIVNFNGI